MAQLRETAAHRNRNTAATNMSVLGLLNWFNKKIKHGDVLLVP